MPVPYAEVIGDPIGHSKSPLIHKFWLEKLGMEGDYRRSRIVPSKLAEYLAGRRHDPHWRGCNVTMPLKTVALGHLCEVAEEAGRLGAVNCIAPKAGTLWGTNFDSAAVTQIMTPSGAHGEAVLLGAGGAARAALWALARLDFDRITIMARNPAKAQEMIESLGVEAEAVPLVERIACDALINATPLGMSGGAALDFDLSGMPAASIVFDMVYDPLETPLLAAARRRGCRTIDGLTMLIAQAALSFAAFFGRAPAAESMTELRERLSG